MAPQNKQTMKAAQAGLPGIFAEGDEIRKKQPPRCAGAAYAKRHYRVRSVDEAKSIAGGYVKNIALEKVVFFGLPEVDDRYHVWRVPLKNGNDKKIGEVVIDARTSLIQEQRTTRKRMLEARILGRKTDKKARSALKGDIPKISNIRNTVGLGDSEDLLLETPSESIDLVFTSPPYYNARPEYSDYIQYEQYLLKMRKIINQCRRVLNEGRFCVFNVSPVLIRRASRSTSSKRIAYRSIFTAFLLKRVLTLSMTLFGLNRMARAGQRDGAEDFRRTETHFNTSRFP